MTTEPGPTIGELSRQVQGVLVRVESVVSRLETQYVRNDLYLLGQKNVDDRITQLEDDKKWLYRLVIGFIVTAVLVAVFTISGGSK